MYTAFKHHIHNSFILQSTVCSMYNNQPKLETSPTMVQADNLSFDKPKHIKIFWVY